MSDAWLWQTFLSMVRDTSPCLATNISVVDAVRARISTEGKEDFMNAFSNIPSIPLGVYYVTYQPLIGLMKSQDKDVVKMSLALLTTAQCMFDFFVDSTFCSSHIQAVL